MSIDYFSGDYSRKGTFVNYGTTEREKFNGNIKSVRWNTEGIAKPTNGKKQWMYSYEYNKKQWLKKATFGAYALDQCQNQVVLWSKLSFFYWHSSA